MNRTVGGVHYPVDSWAGAALGTAVAEVILCLCSCDEGFTLRHAHYDVNEVVGVTGSSYTEGQDAGGDHTNEGQESLHLRSPDFTLAQLDGGCPEEFGLWFGNAVKLAGEPLFQWLWREVNNELYGTP